MTGCLAEIDELVALSQAGSAAPMLVQGPGGNASVKSADGQRLWIKASGVRLSDVTDRSGFVTVDLAAARSVLDSAELAAQDVKAAHAIAAAKVAQAVLSPPGERASLETLFHTMFDRCVLHTHAVYANAFACMSGGAAELARILNEPVCAVPYEAPGYALARLVQKSVRSHFRRHGEQPPFVLLQNHGLIASGKDMQGAVRTTEKIVAAGSKYFGYIREDAPTAGTDPACEEWAGSLAAAYLKRAGKKVSTAVIAGGPLRRAAANPLTRLLNGHLCPDEAVFFDGSVRVCPARVRAEEWLNYFRLLPTRLVAVIPDRGVVLLAHSQKTLRSMEEGLAAHVLVTELVQRAGAVRTLTPGQAEYLTSMVEEKHRQQRNQ